MSVYITEAEILSILDRQLPFSEFDTGFFNRFWKFKTKSYMAI